MTARYRIIRENGEVGACYEWSMLLQALSDVLRYWRDGYGARPVRVVRDR